MICLNRKTIPEMSGEAHPQKVVTLDLLFEKCRIPSA